MTILAIETSCDETAAAVLRDGRLLSNVVASQEEHWVYGGVVPELASRAHIAKIVPIVEKALAESRLTIDQMDAIAATYGPGLIGSLLVGLTFAKGLALTMNLPFYGVNHLEGHLFSATIENPEVKFPFLGLVVSGGHTLLCRVHEVDRYEILGQTRDDAAGEAFDKVAKILGLPYPGGPAVEQLAAGGDPEAIKFPIAKLKGAPFDFSFSGLKTAVLYYYRGLTPEDREKQRANIAASFQRAAIQALTDKLVLAVQKMDINRVVVAGGVAQNKTLAETVRNQAKKVGFSSYFPASEYCTDNAAMIARAAEFHFLLGESSPLSLPPMPNLTLNSQNGF